MREDILKRIKEKVHALPLKPGVYKMLDINGNIIYIGKAKILKNRVSSYFINTVKLPKVQQMVDMMYDFEYIITPSELEALNLESNLIHKHQPFYNILLKDGKAFPYIKIDYKSKYPKVMITRKILRDDSMYFGPFFNKINAGTLLKIINSTFMLRDCSISMDRMQKRECLNYHIHECFAPCTRRCTELEYRAEVDKVVDFLKGDLSLAQERLSEKMNKFAELEMFEKAIEIRENLKALEAISARNITGLNKNTDIDVFGYADDGHNTVITVSSIRGNKMIGLTNYSLNDASDNYSDTMANFVTQYYLKNKLVPKNIVVRDLDESVNEWLDDFAGKRINVLKGVSGTYLRLLTMANDNASEYMHKTVEKENLYSLKTMGAMKTLQKSLGLRSLPHRIEGYDISNLGGTNTVSSMVVFIDGVPAKKHYRKFKITTDGQNDFRNMHDTLTRRFGEYRKGEDLSFSCLPDLILIDGGNIQLDFAHNAMIENGFDIDMVSLAKKEEEIYLVNGDKVILSRDNFALKLLQSVRDESHRFAITFQKSLRLKKAITSDLENIPLLGKNKANLLFTTFKSIDKIKSASIQELMSVKGIGSNMAKSIFDYFHPSV